MNQKKLTASSCAVENHPDGDIRLTMDFMNLDEYSRAHDQFHGHSFFIVDKSDPRSGGSIGGSRLVIHIGRDFAAAAIGELPPMEIRRRVEFVSGARTPCANVADALSMAILYT